jgi:hypothetical protein
LEAILVRAKEALVEQKELVEARRKEVPSYSVFVGKNGIRIAEWKER